MLVVEAPVELATTPECLSAWQDSSRLKELEGAEGCWQLNRSRGRVVVAVQTQGTAEGFDLTLPDEEFMVFKLVGQRLTRGRQVRCISQGPYLVVTPDSWARDEEAAGPAPVEPEYVSVPGLLAHHFDLKDDDKRPAFIKPDGQRVELPRQAGFRLSGQVLEDATEDMGALYGPSPPTLCPVRGMSWADVGHVWVGEEGKERDRWYRWFTGPQCRHDGEPGASLAGRLGGWYSLRVYDAQDRLLESLTFRFLQGVSAITAVPRPQPLPPEGGYRAVTVRFSHLPGWVVRPADSLSEGMELERGEEQSVLTIPADPAQDKTRWIAGLQHEGHVTAVAPLTVLMERLWWAAGELDSPPAEWTDRRLVLKRDDLRATSSGALWFRLPRPRWVGEVEVGFGRNLRQYEVEVRSEVLRIPLREFEGCKEREDRTREHGLRVSLRAGGNTHETIVGVLPRERTWVAWGEKKSATAEARLSEAKTTGAVQVQGVDAQAYFSASPLKGRAFFYRLLELPCVREVLQKLEVSVTVSGSNLRSSAQAKAVAHAVARALAQYKPDLGPELKRAGYGGRRPKREPPRRWDSELG